MIPSTALHRSLQLQVESGRSHCNDHVDQLLLLLLLLLLQAQAFTASNCCCLQVVHFPQYTNNEVQNLLLQVRHLDQQHIAYTASLMFRAFNTWNQYSEAAD